MVQLWSRRIRSSERLLEKVPPAEGPWDDFGFVGLGPIVKDSKHFRSDYAIKQKLQRKRWEEYIGKYGWGIQMLKTSDALRDIVRYGIPDELKGTCANTGQRPCPVRPGLCWRLLTCVLGGGGLQAAFGRSFWAVRTAFVSSPASTRTF